LCTNGALDNIVGGACHAAAVARWRALAFNDANLRETTHEAPPRFSLVQVAAALVAAAASLPLGVYQITSQDTQLLLRHCDYQAFATPNEAGGEC